MLRRIFAASFALAALTMTAGAPSATADDYGPDDFPCTIELSNGTVPANATATVRVTCDENPTDAAAAGAGTAGSPAMAEGGTVATPMVAHRITPASLFRAAGLATSVDGEEVTLMVADEEGEIVRSETFPAPIGRTDTVQVADLEPGDYTLMLVDEDGTECADRASLTVMPMPPGRQMPPGGGDLAATGSTGLPYLAVAGGLLVAGVATLVVLRRARSRA